MSENSALPNGWQLVVGLEVHVELATKTKMFSASANRFGDEPNTNIDPVTLGLPGALPVLNKQAVELAMRIGLALNCKVQPCTFHRKNYFYPDLPKAYQITQYDHPLNVDGFLMLPGDVYYLIAPAEASSNLARYDGVRYGNRVDAADLNAMYAATRESGFGEEVKRRIMLGTYALSAGYYDAYYGKALKVRRLISDDFARAYKDVDTILTPTSPSTAFKFGSKTDNPLAMYLCDVFTIPTNLAGHPAMSVPFGVGADSMPVGIQVLATTMGEQAMFKVAAELERAS